MKVYSKKCLILLVLIFALSVLIPPHVSAQVDDYPLLGDVNYNGVIDIADVILVLRMALDLDEDDYCADINDNDVIDIADVIMTLRIALQLDPVRYCEYLMLNLVDTELVGIGRTSILEVTLSAPATGGGVTVTVTSDDENIVSVTPPGTVFIPEGSITGYVTLNGIAAGTVTVRANAAGYDEGILDVQTTEKIISLPTTLTVPLGRAMDIPVTIAPDPAPPGGIEVTLTSSDPSIAEVMTQTVTIPEGAFSANGQVFGQTAGIVTVTGQNPDYASDVSQVVVNASINIIQSTFDLIPAFPADIAIRLESAGSAIAAPAPGVTVSLTTTDPDCVTVTSPVIIPAGQVSTSATISYGGTATLPCLATITANAPNITSDIVEVTVSQQPEITLFRNPGTVGSGLISDYSGTRAVLGGSNHGGVTVRIASSDPAVALVSPDINTPGTASIDVPVADGNTLAYYRIQGVEGTTGTVDITASATGFTSVSGTTEVVQPAFAISGLVTAATSLSSDDPFYVRVGIPNASGTNVTLQRVRPGAAALIATLMNSNAAVGQLTTTSLTGQTVTVEIPAGEYYSATSVAAGGVAFDPLDGGTTTVSASIPGFSATTAASVEVTVTTPEIIFQYHPSAVGSGLTAGSTNTRARLGGSDHGGVTVRIASSDPAVALVSPDINTPGTASIDVPVADGQRYANYYVQGVEGTTGTVDITASATGFTSVSGTTEVVQPAVAISQLATDTTSLSPDDSFQVRVGIPNASGTNVSLQRVRPGVTTLIATVTSSDATVGQITSTASTGQTVTVEIPAGEYYSATSVAAGGVAFDPLDGGTTTVSASIPGFSATTAASVEVTVTTPAITLQSPYHPATVGSGLIAGSNYTRAVLGGADHGGVTVRITSSDPAVALVSPDSVTPGTDYIDVPVADGQTYANYNVQGVEGATGSVEITPSAPGFTSVPGTTEVVQPGFVINGLVTDTTTLSVDDPFYIRAGIPNASGTNVSVQRVRPGGAALIATVTSSDGTVGQLTTTASTGQTVTVEIPVGQHSSPSNVAAGGIAFDPLTSGITTVSASIQGFIATTAASVDVTVTASGITMGNEVPVGSGLMSANLNATLEGTSHGGVIVHIESSNPSIALVSPDQFTGGTPSIDVLVADGQERAYYRVQGLEGTTGSVEITVSAPGFISGSRTATVVQPGLTIYRLLTSMTSSSPDDPFQVRVGVPNISNTNISVQAVRPGVTALTATVTNSDAAVGQLATTDLTDQTVTVEIPAGQYYSASSVVNGGVAFDPLAVGSTIVEASIPDFITTTAGRVTVDVTP